MNNSLARNVTAGQEIDRICDEFEQGWQSGNAPNIDDFLSSATNEYREELIAELVALDVGYRQDQGEALDVNHYLERYPEAKRELRPILISLLDQTVGGNEDTEVGTKKRVDHRLKQIGKDFGNYELIDEIARGGMGVIYRARQKSTNRVVALKMILAGQFANEEEIKRFHAEAQAIGQLDHPNIVPVYDAGEKDGYHYIAMGFVDGGDLNRFCGEQKLNHETIATILLKLAEAMNYAHENQIVHRD